MRFADEKVNRSIEPTTSTSNESSPKKQESSVAKCNKASYEGRAGEECTERDTRGGDASYHGGFKAQGNKDKQQGAKLTQATETTFHETSRTSGITQRNMPNEVIALRNNYASLRSPIDRDFLKIFSS